MKKLLLLNILLIVSFGTLNAAQNKSCVELFDELLAMRIDMDSVKLNEELKARLGPDTRYSEIRNEIKTLKARKHEIDNSIAPIFVLLRPVGIGESIKNYFETEQRILELKDESLCILEEKASGLREPATEFAMNAQRVRLQIQAKLELYPALLEVLQMETDSLRAKGYRN